MKNRNLVNAAGVLVSALALIAVIIIVLTSTACSRDTVGTRADTETTLENASMLQRNQPTPTDISYSLERYNLIRRAYWVNGQRERAAALPCEVEKPLGYIVLFSHDVTVGSFVVDGKVSSLNSFLTPDSEYYEVALGSEGTRYNRWLADVDGSYGANDSGIFFFTPDGKYIEWTGDYLYSDIPFSAETPVLTIGGAN